MESRENWLIAIPARLESTRLPEKPLIDLGGKPLIVRVHDRLKPLKSLGAKVVVATDHQKVLDVCKQHAIDATMTDKNHNSGTDRCLEVASAINHRKFVLNVQGDEPFIDCKDLENLKTLLENQSNHQKVMGTLIHQNTSSQDYFSPDCVKAVINRAGDALYFSRSPVPYNRDTPSKIDYFWQHIGVYGFHYSSLSEFCRLPESRLERHERLEQLRALENGFTIKTAKSQNPSLGIDTPNDLEVAREKF